MARPNKVELDYYQEDCSISQNWELLSIKHGGIVFSIYYTIRNRIFAQKGYYLDWSDEFKILHSGRFHIPYEILDKVVNEAIEIGIYDKEMYEKYSILTSEEIQQTYIFGSKKRRKNIIAPEHCLVSKEEIKYYFKEEEVSEEKNMVSEEETRVYDEESTHNNRNININNNKNIYSNKKNEKNNYLDSERENNNEIKAFGLHKNIMLLEEQYEEFKKEYPHGDRIIEGLSEYALQHPEVGHTGYALLKRYAKAGFVKPAPPPPKRDLNYLNNNSDIYETARYIEERRKEAAKATEGK